MNKLISTILEPWDGNISFDDPGNREIGRLCITLLISIAAGTLIWLPATFFVFESRLGIFYANLPSVLFWLTSLVAYWLITKGKVLQGAILIASSIFCGITLVLIATGVTRSGGLLFVYSLPLTIMGIVWGRKGLMLFGGASMLTVGILALLEYTDSFSSTMSLEEPSEIFLTFLLPFLLLFLILERSHTSARRALLAGIERSKHLAEIQESLDKQIIERSQHLESTLARVHEQEQELQERLQELEHARKDLQERSPILPVMPGLLVVPLVGELSAARAQQLHQQVLQRCHQERAQIAIFDLTGLASLDQAACQALRELALAIQMIGARFAMAGLRADIVDTLIANDIDRQNIEIYASLQEALASHLLSASSANSAKK